MTIGPDQSLLISIGILALTLIGCESNQAHPQVEHMGLLHSLFLFIFRIFFFVCFYLFHTLFTVCDGRKTVYILDTKKTKKEIQHMCCHYYEN